MHLMIWRREYEGMNRRKDLFKNTLILGIGVIGTKIITIIMLPFYTKWLSVSDYGMVDLFTTILAVAVPIITLQLEQAVFRYLIDADTNKLKQAYISTGIISVLFILLICNSILIPICFLSNNSYKYLFIVGINSNVLLTVLLQIIRGIGNNRLYTYNSILVSFINLVLSILLIHIFSFGGKGAVFSVIFSNIVGVVFIIIFGNIYSYINIKYYSKEILKALLKYSVPMITNNVSWWVLNASDKLLIGYFLGAESNGVYAAAGKIAYIVTTLYTVFSMAWQESAARAAGDENKEEYYSNTFRSIFSIIMIGSGLLLIMLPIVFKILINNKFNEAYIHSIILVTAMIFWCIATFLGGIYVGIKKTKNLGVTSLIAAIINLIINLLLINKIGIFAATLSTIISYIVIMVMRIINLKKYVYIKYNKKEIVIQSIFVISSIFIAIINNIAISILIFIVVFIFMIYKYLNSFLSMLKK